MKRRNFLKFGGISTIAILPGIGNIAAEDKVKPDDKDFWERVLKRVEEFQIRKFGRPLDDHPALREVLDITHDLSFFRVCVAQHWGLAPSELESKGIDDRIDIYAWFVANRQIRRVEIWYAMRKQRRHSEKAPSLPRVGGLSLETRKNGRLTKRQVGDYW